MIGRALLSPDLPNVLSIYMDILARGRGRAARAGPIHFKFFVARPGPEFSKAARPGPKIIIKSGPARPLILRNGPARPGPHFFLLARLGPKRYI